MLPQVNEPVITGGEGGHLSLSGIFRFLCLEAPKVTPPPIDASPGTYYPEEEIKVTIMTSLGMKPFININVISLALALFPFLVSTFPCCLFLSLLVISLSSLLSPSHLRERCDAPPLSSSLFLFFPPSPRRRPLSREGRGEGESDAFLHVGSKPK